jgi:hypothetical protein
MIAWAARLFLLRILPRRLVPFLTFIELAMLARGLLRRRRRPQPPVAGPVRAADARRLPPWREFGRREDPDGGTRQVGPGSGATLRR